MGEPFVNMESHVTENAIAEKVVTKNVAEQLVSLSEVFTFLVLDEENYSTDLGKAVSCI